MLFDAIFSVFDSSSKRYNFYILHRIPFRYLACLAEIFIQTFCYKEFFAIWTVVAVCRGKWECMLLSGVADAAKQLLWNIRKGRKLSVQWYMYLWKVLDLLHSIGHNIKNERKIQFLCLFFKMRSQTFWIILDYIAV